MTEPAETDIDPATDATEAGAIQNILAMRYASQQMRHIWSATEKVRRERRLWLCILKAQQDLGLDIPADAPAAFEAKLDDIDLASIAAREARTRHDLKARIEEFCELAGHECIHLGLTSRDITENIEQAQLRDSLLALRTKAVAALAALAERAQAYAALPVAGRTHNVVAQPTTFGKRLAACGEELIVALEGLDSLLARMRLRGLKGAVGTQQDLAQLFDGDLEKIARLEQSVAQHLGFESVQVAAAQVYPRSWDLDFVGAVLRLVAGPASLAVTLRLMAGHGHVAEGFAQGQIGSSAMPHKQNPRLCERIGGLKAVLAGHLAVAAELSGAQWNEGDVSCSVARRVMLPDACFAGDGLLDTFLAVLADLRVFEDSMAAEAQGWQLELASTRLLTAAVAAGMGRELAHEKIRGNIVAADSGQIDPAGARSPDPAGALPTDPAELARQLGADKDFPLDEAQVLQLLDDPVPDTGAAANQVAAFVEQAQPWIDRFPEAREYRPQAPI